MPAASVGEKGKPVIADICGARAEGRGVRIETIVLSV
jgi:hypothetical protein